MDTQGWAGKSKETTRQCWSQLVYGPSTLESSPTPEPLHQEYRLAELKYRKVLNCISIFSSKDVDR